MPLISSFDLILMTPSALQVCCSKCTDSINLFGHVLLRLKKKVKLEFCKLIFPSPRIEKRDKYSRRRPYNDDADIDYINERNAKFNKKAERFYGKYTAEIKQNLERGTAV